MSCHSCRVIISYLILAYFNRPDGSTRRLPMDIFAQVFASMVSYCFFSDKWPDWVNNFGLACRNNNTFRLFLNEIGRGFIRQRSPKILSRVLQYVFFWGGFAWRLGTCEPTRTFGASFRVKLLHIHYQTCREYRTNVSSLTWNHTAVLAKREFYDNSQIP